MIRLRRKDGTVLELKDFAFVEVCDTEGAIAQLIYPDQNGAVHVVSPSDPEAENFRRLFPGVQFTKIIDL